VFRQRADQGRRRSGFESRFGHATALRSLVLGIGIVLAAVGCSLGDSGEDPVEGTAPTALERRTVPTFVKATAVKGGSIREKSLLQDAIDGMESTSLKKIVISGPAARRKTDGGRVIALQFTSIPAETARRQWDAWVVTGAFSRRLLAAGLPAEVDAKDDGGAFTARPRLKGTPDPKPLPPAREAAIVKALRRAATKAKAEVVTLEVHRPYGVAIALSLAPADTGHFLKTQLRPFFETLDAHRSRLEGIYLAVLDGERELALEWGSWTRNPVGVYWVRRDLASCSPIRQSDPPGTPPAPACPKSA
jgi:hypothetical protein